MESHSLRIYLTGKLAIEAGGKVVDDVSFPARQGRKAFAYLIRHRTQVVFRDTLADAIWGASPPARWETALSALVSKLRGLFAQLDLPSDAVSIDGHVGYYSLKLPPDAWVDVESALSSVDMAEGALRVGKTSTGRTLSRTSL